MNPQIPSVCRKKEAIGVNWTLMYWRDIFGLYPTLIDTLTPDKKTIVTFVGHSCIRNGLNRATSGENLDYLNCQLFMIEKQLNLSIVLKILATFTVIKILVNDSLKYEKN